jgi:nucleoside-diphosphate-sugar epimerase
VSGWSKRKVLVTGGLGFIGSNLARRLVALGAEVTLVDSLVPEYGGNRFNIRDIEHSVRVNISDVRDRHSFRTLIEGQDVLFNLAGQTSHQDSMTDPFTDLDINCTSQLAILEACRSANPGVRVVFASTRQIYGRPDYLPVDESHPLRPADVNGINKMAGEWYHLLYSSVYGIRACALRLTNTYGPGMRIRDARQTFLGIWIRLLLEGRPIEVWGGEQLRDFNHVDDVVDALLLAADSDQTPGQVYNLGASQVVSLKQLAETLISANGGGEFVLREFPAERKRIDIGDYYADFGKLSALGWQPSVPLAKGLADTLAYYRDNLAYYV